MRLWHARPLGRRVMTAGFHAGTFEQARMRHPQGEMLIVELWPDIPVKRIRDTGSWSEGSYNVSRSSSAGFVYLNRYEGLSLESIQRLTSEVKDPDRLSDSAFLKYAPEARDSYIILDPSWIRIFRKATKIELKREFNKGKGKKVYDLDLR